MVTYWLTGYPCPSCGKTADTKFPYFGEKNKIEKFQEELDSIRKKITSSLVTEPSNGWPYPSYDSSWRIGLVKIRTGKKQYSMKCFSCDFETNESEYKVYLESLKDTRTKKKVEKSKEIESSQPTLDQYLYCASAGI